MQPGSLRIDPSVRFDHERRLDPYIERFVPHGARVIDLGCGSGELMERLVRNRNIFARGVEISSDGVKACIQKGLSVYQGDIDDGFKDFDDGVFDRVILNLTLSMVHYPDLVLDEVVRIGKQAIVSFYNSAYFPHRGRFLREGSMEAVLPGNVSWCRNPHIHPFSVRDLDELCDRLGISVVERTIVDRQFRPLKGGQAAIPQMAGYAGVYMLQRA